MDIYEHIFIEATRDFFLLSGALENDFCINDFNPEFARAVIDEQFGVCVLN